MHRSRLFLCFFALLGLVALSQQTTVTEIDEELPVKKLAKSVKTLKDTTLYKTDYSSEYIIKYKKVFVLSPALNIYFPNIELENGKSRTEASYIPSRNATYGLGFYYYWIVLNVYLTASGKNSGLLSQLETRIFFNHKLSAEFNYIKNNEFYLNEYKGFDPKDYGTALSGVRSDIQTQLVRGAIFYVPKGDKFSFQSLFNPMISQIKSAGSPIVNLSVFLNRFNAGYAVMPNDKNTLGTEPIGYSRLNLGFSGGYGYSYVFAKHFLASGVLMTGVNYLSDTNTSRNNTLASDADFGYNTYLLLGVGYNTTRMRFDISFINRGIQYRGVSASSDITSVTYSDSYLKFLYIYRFDVGKSRLFNVIENAIHPRFLFPKRQRN